MQQIFQTLQRFLQSPACIFDFKSMDYPTEFQQHLITSHFQTALLLKTHSHNDIVRLLHTSERALETFIPGVVYQMLLDPANTHTFETYMPSLRTESWTSFAKLTLQLLRDSFLWIKPHLRCGIVPLLAKLFYYRQLEVDHLILAVKTIDYTDLSEQALNYNSLMLAFFQQILADSNEKQHSYILAKTLFYKIFRMLSLLVCIEDEVLRQYKIRCVTLAEKIFQLQKERCLMIGNSGLNVFRQVEGEQLMLPLLAQLREALNSCELSPQSPKSASLRLASVLPMKVETTLLFIVREQISKIEIKLQLDWTFEQANEHTLLVVMDILRYILALPVEELPMKDCLTLLEWLFYRICSNNILFQIWKDELFFSCFAEPCPFPAAPERAIHFLAYLLDIDIDFGQTLLIYLLRNIHIPDKADALRNLLVRADELQILNVSGLINHPRLRARTKEELITALGRRSVNRGAERNDQAVVYYDPLAVVMRKESEMSMEFSDSVSSEEYLDSSEQMEQPKDNQLSREGNKMGKIKLQKMFAQDMGQTLSELLTAPTLPIYRQFYKKFITVTKEFRLNGQQPLIDTFLGEAAKISYVLFQNQFQNHQEVIPKQQNIIFYLLNIVALQWRTNSFHGQITKKLIKKIAQYFATAQMTLWRNFLIFFKRSMVPACKEMKEWLVPKQKLQYAIPLLRQLGPLTRQLIQNAQSLKMPLSL